MDISNIISTATAIAALLAVAATIHAARRQRASDLQSSASQIEASFQLLSRQLEGQSKLAYAQIEAARDQALQEIKAQVLSKNRQEWINDVRNTLSNYIVSIHKYRNNLNVPANERDPALIGTDVSEAWLHLTRLRLLINPKEDDHTDLLTTANLMFDASLHDNHKIKDIERILLIKAQEILKREWERVKSLD